MFPVDAADEDVVLEIDVCVVGFMPVLNFKHRFRGDGGAIGV